MLRWAAQRYSAVPGTALQQRTSTAAICACRTALSLCRDSRSAHQFAVVTANLPHFSPAHSLSRWRPEAITLSCWSNRFLLSELRKQRLAAPLPWVALTLLLFAQLDATVTLPTPPGLDAVHTVPRYQTPALRGPAVGPAPALHPGCSEGTDTLVLIASISGVSHSLLSTPPRVGQLPCGLSHFPHHTCDKEVFYPQNIVGCAR